MLVVLDTNILDTLVPSRSVGRGRPRRLRPPGPRPRGPPDQCRGGADRPRGRAGRGLPDDTHQHGPADRHGLRSGPTTSARCSRASSTWIARAARCRAWRSPGSRWATSRGSSRLRRGVPSTTARRSTPTPCSSTSTACSGRTSTSGASRTCPPRRFDKTYPFVYALGEGQRPAPCASTPASLRRRSGTSSAASRWCPRTTRSRTASTALNERPVGTGPWKLVEWKRKDSMRFERYDGYWGRAPGRERLRFQVIPEAAARLAALRAGQVAARRRGAPARRRASSARDGAIKVASQPAEAHLPALPERPAQGHVRLGRQGRPLRRPRVRLALEPRRQPGRDRQEDLPRLRPGQRLAGRHGLLSATRPRSPTRTIPSAPRRCSPRRAGRTRTATASSTRAARCSRSSSCSPPSTTARASTRRRRRWPRCSRRSGCR